MITKNMLGLTRSHIHLKLYLYLVLLNIVTYCNMDDKKYMTILDTDYRLNELIHVKQNKVTDLNKVMFLMR